MKHICQPQAACGPPFTNSSVPQSHHEQTAFFTTCLLLGSWTPLHQLQITRTSGLLSPCPPLVIRSLTRRVRSSPPQSFLKVLPVSWPRCRGCSIRPSVVVSRPPSWLLALLRPSHSCNYAFHGPSSLYSPGAPKAMSSLLFPLSYIFLPCQFHLNPQGQVLLFVGDSLYLLAPSFPLSSRPTN